MAAATIFFYIRKLSHDADIVGPLQYIQEFERQLMQYGNRSPNSHECCKWKYN